MQYRRCWSVALLALSLLTSFLLAPLTQAAGITVTSAADSQTKDGHCTLREAILNANYDNQSGSTDCAPGNGSDTIIFNGNYTVNLAESLPPLTGHLTIDGGSYTVAIRGNSEVVPFNIYAEGQVTLNHLSVISSTSGSLTGGIWNSGALTISQSTLNDNSGLISGGLYNNGGIITIRDSVFNNNNGSYGGAIYNFGTLTITNSQFNGNSNGGAIYNMAVLTVTNSIFNNNSAYSGGAIFNQDALTLQADSFNNNSAINGDGGAIYNNGNILTITNSTFDDNSASRNGGGIHNSHLGARLAITGSTFSYNLATDGGSIYNEFGTVTVSNSTFSGNMTTSNGGGLLNNFGTLTVTNSTLTNNMAGKGGGIYNNFQLHLRNTLIANSLSGGDCVTEFSGMILTNLNNLIEDGSCSPALSGDPNLGPLQHNGGPPTGSGLPTFTHALLFPSPAIDAGDLAACPATDQRNLRRPYDGNGDDLAACDIGAFEALPLPTAFVYLPIVGKR